MSKDNEIFKANFITEEVEQQPWRTIERIKCHSDNKETKLELDIHSGLFKLKPGDSFIACIVEELTSNGIDPKVHWCSSMIPESISKNYEYVLHGELYRYEEDSNAHQSTIYVSFGGLLMKLSGETAALSDIKPHNTMYLLCRRLIK